MNFIRGLLIAVMLYMKFLVIFVAQFLILSYLVVFGMFSATMGGFYRIIRGKENENHLKNLVPF